MSILNDNNFENVDASQYLDNLYPKSGDYYNSTCVLINKNYKKISKLDLSNLNLVGKLDLSRFKYLEDLDCSHNQINELVLNNNIQLRKLNCSFNNLQILNLNSNQFLIEVDASDNQLTEFNFWENSLKVLRKLNISNNNIKITNANLFKNFTSLELLWIGTWNVERIKNKIYNRFHGSFKSFENLEKLESLFVTYTNINRDVEYLPISLSRKNSKIFWYLHFPNEILPIERTVNTVGKKLNMVRDDFGSLLEEKINANKSTIYWLEKNIKSKDKIENLNWELRKELNYLETKFSLIRGLEIPNPIIKENSEYSKCQFSTNLIGFWRGKDVTLKVVKNIKKESYEDDFRNILRLSSLKHRNISNYLSSFYSEKDCLEIVLEYNNEKNLSDLIVMNEDFQYDDKFLRIIFNCIDGLTYLHGNYIEHGNLNLDNVIISDKFEAKLKDFSLKDSIKSLGEKFNKENNEMKISDFFFQPKNDVFQLGVLILCVFSQESNYNRKEGGVLWYSNKEPLDLILNNIDGNEEVAEIIEECLEENIEFRSSLYEVSFDLKYLFSLLHEDDYKLFIEQI